MGLYRVFLMYLVVVIVQAENNQTESNFFSKYPVATGVVTGLSIVALVFSFCCCLLLCYVCMEQDRRPPTIFQSVSESLRRGNQPPVIEAHATAFSTRDTEHEYEQVLFHPKMDQPPRIPSTPRPSERPQSSTSTSKISQAPPSKIPQPKMGIQVHMKPTPKKRGLKKAQPLPYVNLDPALVAAEQMLTHEATDSANNFRSSIKRMMSFRPLKGESTTPPESDQEKKEETFL